MRRENTMPFEGYPMIEQLVHANRDQSVLARTVLDCDASSYLATGRYARACEDAGSLLPGNASAALRS